MKYLGIFFLLLCLSDCNPSEEKKIAFKVEESKEVMIKIDSSTYYVNEDFSDNIVRFVNNNTVSEEKNFKGNYSIDILQKNGITLRLESTNTHFKTANSESIYKYNKPLNINLIKPYSLNINLFSFINENNNKVSDNQSVSLDDLYLIHTIINKAIQDNIEKFPKYSNSNDYYKQIRFSNYKEGKLTVWVNCLRHFHDNWKSQIIEVEDGGSSYFNLEVDIQSKSYKNLYINGIA